MNKSREFVSRNAFKTAAIFIFRKQIKAWLLIEDDVMWESTRYASADAVTTFDVASIESSMI